MASLLACTPDVVHAASSLEATSWCCRHAPCAAPDVFQGNPHGLRSSRHSSATHCATSNRAVVAFTAGAAAGVLLAVPRRRETRISRRATGGVDQDVNPVALALRSRLQELAVRDGGRGSQRWEDLGGARVILPASAIPWGVAHFVGGAVLGQFPELCYDTLLRPLADRAGIAVICTPYELAPDHFKLADKVGDAFESAMVAGAARYGWVPERMPRFALGHSLGSKLQVLLQCQNNTPAVGVGLLAFNNFGVEDQVRLLRETLQALGVNAGPVAKSADRFWQSVLEPALGRVAKLSGMQFKPGPEEMLALVANDYDKSAGKTRAICFDQDNLDCSDELLEALSERGAFADRVNLQGGHLTPVLLNVQDVAGAAAANAPGPTGKVMDQFSERLGGVGGSLGNEAECERLVDELVLWVRGTA